jgi:hypothetical protein
LAKIFNLNSFEPETDQRGKFVKHNKNNSVITPDIDVYFRNLPERLCEQIENAHLVVGCVAWLTHPEILAALATVEAAIVVQKEDFLRPDLGVKSGWKQNLRASYDALRCRRSRWEFGNMISSLSTCDDISIGAVRCVGNLNRERSPAFPRMHNKFLVFCRIEDQENCEAVTPYAAWTGSFNLTNNAANSLENALLVRQPEVVQAYFAEFGQIMALSEQLDWESEWAAPEWRIGS